MSKTCPNMTSESAPANVITATTINEIQLTTFNKSVGAVVGISCYGARTLYGVNQTTCQANGKWDYPAVPKCIPNKLPTTSTSSLTKEQMIIVGVFSGIGALLLIILLAIIIAVCLRKRRKKEEKYKEASVYSYPSAQAGYKPFSYGGYRNSYTNEWARGPRRYNGYDNPTAPPPRTTHYGYNNAAFPMELEAESPYRFVHHHSKNMDNEVYRGVPSSREDYNDMSHYNRYAESEGRDPFLWRPDSPRSYYN